MTKHQQPKASRAQLAVLRPTGEVFVNGLASWYDDEFPPSCAPHMTPAEFSSAMTKINEVLSRSRSTKMCVCVCVWSSS